MQTTCEHFSSFQPKRNHIIRPATPRETGPLSQKKLPVPLFSTVFQVIRIRRVICPLLSQ
jgi:hypothetical protein